MTAQEIAEAKIVFGNTLDYDHIYFASESLLNDIIFGIQDFFSGNPESRAFVTDTLVNFDVDDGIERHTMIHELTHVWQFAVTGPFYMSEAIHAQVAGAGYNYGYDEGVSNVTIPVDYAGNTETLDAGESPAWAARRARSPPPGTSRRSTASSRARSRCTTSSGGCSRGGRPPTTRPGSRTSTSCRRPDRTDDQAASSA